MRERLRRWSEDETVGRALFLAGAIILVVQVLPDELLRVIESLWPLAIVAIGVVLILRNRAPSPPAG